MERVPALFNVNANIHFHCENSCVLDDFDFALRLVNVIISSIKSLFQSLENEAQINLQTYTSRRTKRTFFAYRIQTKF